MPAEFDLIARFFTRATRTAALGVGDDCALVKPPTGLALAITTDLLAEGTHFLPGADPRRLGHKSLAVNLSDLAAMGADPRWFLLAVALPDVDEVWLTEFAAGMFALADAHGIELIGGDTTRGPRNICITAMGTLPPGYALRRDAASAGEDIWLSGSTGDAALGLAHLKGKIRLGDEALARCLARLEAPEPRVALGRKLRGLASSAIDVSDGLLADLGHIAERSRLGAELDYDLLPRSPMLLSCPETALADACLLAGGDDYELVFTASSTNRSAIEAAGRAADVAVTRIGRVVTDGARVTVVDSAGDPINVAERGFEHFR
jgi:thiamine-monophosphate kinase